MPGAVLDHVSIGVDDMKAALPFYEETLKVLGFKKCYDYPEMVGFGTDEEPSFWLISTGTGVIGNAKGVHVCFKATSVEMIKAWHAACIEHGGKCYGPPGPRPEYHPNYYAAFITDPSGWQLEAVIHTYNAEEAAKAEEH